MKESDTMRALSELSNKDGRRSNANNLVLDDMMGFDQLDAKVNEYPQVCMCCEHTHTHTHTHTHIYISSIEFADRQTQTILYSLYLI